mmetsp:Transcript_6355/g.10780  ORF Transcript_6355/g.10780 Transcript_6355/m.10780 type:complete len:233 (-) Transcript_6355:1625-2323(-)
MTCNCCRRFKSLRDFLYTLGLREFSSSSRLSPNTVALRLKVCNFLKDWPVLLRLRCSSRCFISSSELSSLLSEEAITESDSLESFPSASSRCLSPSRSSLFPSLGWPSCLSRAASFPGALDFSPAEKSTESSSPLSLLSSSLLRKGISASLAYLSMVWSASSSKRDFRFWLACWAEEMWEDRSWSSTLEARKLESWLLRAWSGPKLPVARLSNSEGLGWKASGWSWSEGRRL